MQNGNENKIRDGIDGAAGRDGGARPYEHSGSARSGSHSSGARPGDRSFGAGQGGESPHEEPGDGFQRMDRRTGGGAQPYEHSGSARSGSHSSGVRPNSLSGGAGLGNLSGVLRPAIIVVLIFVISLVVIALLSYSGVNVPFFSDTFNAPADTAPIAARGVDTRGGAANNPARPFQNPEWDGDETRPPLLSYSYDVSEGTVFCLYDEYFVECSRDSFYLFDKDGSEVFRKNINFTKPALYQKEDYLLACDFNGRSAFVMNGAKLVWEDAFTSGIVNASVNKDGYVAFVLEAIGYKSCVRVLAPAGRALFDWIIADDYALHSEVSPSGKRFLVNRLKTSEIKLRSRLEFLDMNSEPYMSIDSDSEELFLKTCFLDNDMVAAVSEDTFRLYSEGGELMIMKEYDNIFAMSEFPQNKVVVAAEINNRSVIIEYTPGAIEENVIYTSGQPVRNMSADNGLLYINFGDEIVALRDNGKPASRIKPDTGALYGGAAEKTGVLVVTRRSADIYDFR